MKSIAVLCSGGDSPGMNACLAAICKAGEHQGFRIIGVKNGYQGLIQGKFKSLRASKAKEFIHQGGTFLGSARSEEFKTKKGRAQAAKKLKDKGIDKLIVIGGDGSYAGAQLLSSEHNIKVIGIPGTIDNDLFGTDSTLGYDTALNTVVEAVDKIKDTSKSHRRFFFVEVMGRDAGFIALRSGIAVGADAILIPETPTVMEDLFKTLAQLKKKKKGGIILVAEGDDAGNAFHIAKAVAKENPDYDCKVTVLGHVQRGGRPSAFDRVLAARFAIAAIEGFSKGLDSAALGLKHKAIIHYPLDQATKQHKQLNEGLLHILDLLN